MYLQASRGMGGTATPEPGRGQETRREKWSEPTIRDLEAVRDHEDGSDPTYSTTVFAAVNAVVSLFAANRLRAPSEKVEVTVGDNRVLLYKEVLRRIDKKLAEAGFHNGKIDGIYDAQTRRAMQAYQESIGFRPTGFPDQLTLWRLFNDQDPEAP